MKKMTIIASFVAVFILLGIILGVVFAGNTNNEDKTQLISKVEDQIDYLESNIIEMMNKLNNINFENTTLLKQKITNNNQKSGNTESNQNSSQKGSSSSEGDSEKQEESQNASSGEESSNNSSSGSSELIKYEVKNNSILINGDKPIDWETIKRMAETLYSIWPTVVADLNALKVNSSDILNFSNTLDQVTLSVKQEDKVLTINNLASLYGFLPNYRSQFSQDTQKINVDFTKNCVLNSYALIEQDKWDEIKIYLDNSMNYFTNVMDNVNSNVQNQNRISKTYILLNELNNSINTKDKELFYIKYRNVMEELINL